MSHTTVKHVVPGQPDEIVSVDYVKFDHGTCTLVGYWVHHERATKAMIEFSRGHAFVMNSNGKTVGVYNLEQQQQKEQRHERTEDRVTR